MDPQTTDRRYVPPSLRLALMTNKTVLVGSAFFAFGSIISGIMYSASQAQWIPLLVILIFPLAGLFFAGLGMNDAIKKIRLLKTGKITDAQLTTCIPELNTGLEADKEISFAEYRKYWQTGGAPLGADGQPSDELLKHNRQTVEKAESFLGSHRILVVLLAIFSIVICLVMLFMVTNNDMPFYVNGRKVAKEDATPPILLFMVLCVTVCYIIGRRPAKTDKYFAVMTGKTSMARADIRPTVECSFEFTMPNGNVIRAKDTIDISSRLGDERTEPVIYDPDQPSRAFLLDGMTFPMVRSGRGDWQAVSGIGPWLKFALTILCYALPLFLLISQPDRLNALSVAVDISTPTTAKVKPLQHVQQTKDISNSNDPMRSPADGTVFNYFPRTTELKWKAIPDAMYYNIEIDYGYNNNTWNSEITGNKWIKRVDNDTKFTFDFVGAQPGRWRVWPVFTNGREGEKTEWWEFRYTK